MSRLDVGDFLSVKDSLVVSQEEVLVAYGQVLRVNGGCVEIELYDMDRLVVGKTVVSVGEMLDGDVFSVTGKDPVDIAWEFRKDLEC